MTKIKDLMVPLEEYAVVYEGSTILDAIEALEKAQELCYEQGRHRHREVLICDLSKNIVGKLGKIDIITALEPKYRSKQAEAAISHTSAAGLSPSILNEMIDWYSLWEEPYAVRCAKAADMKVKDFMRVHRSDEYIREDDSVEMAIHQMVMGHHQSLLVTRNRTVVGVLRLIDVFEETTRLCKASRKEPVDTR
jgi:CBS domain